MPPPLSEIVVVGDAFARGRAHGRAAGEQIRAFVHDDFARVNRIRSTPLSPAEVSRLVSLHGRVIEAHVPDLARELEGLAAGADITYEQALMLQLRRELIGAPEGDGGGDCSTLVVRSAAGTIAAQTVDQDGLIADLGVVLRVRPASADAPEVLLFTFAGLLGYLGINSRGLGVVINLLTSDAGPPGVPPYLLVREALSCSTAAEALDRIRRIPRASARALTLIGPDAVICCEFTPAELRSWGSRAFVRTNHFLHPELVAADRLNILSRNGSRRRLDVLSRDLESTALDPEAAFTLLSDHSIYPVGLCAHAEGQIRRPDTVAAVVLRPDLGAMWVRKGHPCESRSHAFRCGEPPRAGG